MKNILIAGGSGLIGSELANFLKSKGYSVKILSRTANANYVLWNPEKREIDSNQVKDTDILINLSGTGIDEKRWTTQRKKALIDSRVDTTNALFELKGHFPQLKQYISASGITAYGFDDGTVEHLESDSFGTDFLSQLVKSWEEAADQFKAIAKVAKLRIAVVISRKGGALPKMSKPVRLGIGSAIGSGKQQMAWVHIEDLVRIFEHAISNELEGSYNTNASNTSNAQLVEAIAKQLNKRLWFPKVPQFIMKLVFGQMAEMLLKGSKASNSSLLKTGFTFNYETLESALQKELK